MSDTELYGLVMCGGKSSRMGRDKAFIEYHNIPQVYYLHGILKQFCSEVIISCSTDQSIKIEDKFLKLVDDEIYKDKGPLTGILTAFKKYPVKNFMVLGCDYPFINETELAAFVATINSETYAAAFYNSEAQLYEPLLACYSSVAGKDLLAAYQNGLVSLQKFLQEKNAFRYFPVNILSVKSVDTPEGEAEVRELLRS